MIIPKVIERTKQFFINTLNQECEVISVKNEEDEFIVVVEAISDIEYTKKRALPDMIAQYVLFMDKNYEVKEYERKELRKRYNLE